MTALPTAPSRSDPANFAINADAFLAALTQFSIDIDPLVASTPQLLAAVNFKGTWTATSYTVPSTIWHSGTGMFYLLLANAAGTDVPGVATTKWQPFYEKIQALSNVTLSGNTVVDVDLSISTYFKYECYFDNYSFSVDSRQLGVAFSTNGTSFGTPYLLDASLTAASNSTTLVTLKRSAASLRGLVLTMPVGSALNLQTATDLIATTVKARFGPVSGGSFQAGTSFDAGNMEVIGYRK